MDDEVRATVTGAYLTENRGWTSRRSFLAHMAGGVLAASIPTRQAFKGDEMPTRNHDDHGQNVSNTHLKWETFVTPSIPVVTTDFAPGEHER